ncbi:GTP binding protein [Aureococcus anophagefferens]|nr:GTP binding protein [Aureococcus anophagefferens]
MGFLTIVRKLRQKEKEMKILIIGLDNAGKTTIVKKFNNEPTDTYANRHWEIQSCSARTGDGLVKGIDWMVDDVASRIMLR